MPVGIEMDRAGETGLESSGQTRYTADADKCAIDESKLLSLEGSAVTANDHVVRRESSGIVPHVSIQG